MATLIEAINAEILVCGGVENTLRIIEEEWSEKTKPLLGSVWTRQELEILNMGIKNLALTLGRSEFSIARKSYNLLYKKALAK